MDSAPRITRFMREAVERAHDPKAPIAEICRRAGDAAERLGEPRPSYESVRRLVHGLRSARDEPTATEVLADVALRTRPPEALLDLLSGVGLERRP